MAVYSIRIPDELKKETENLKSEINWSEEIRHYIAEKIEYHRKRRALMQAIEMIKSTEGVPSGTAFKLVRETRDSH